MRDHDDGEAEVALHFAQQGDEGVRAFRIQPGGGFVQHEQRRVHRQRARQRHALDHAAGELRGHLVRVALVQPHHAELEHGRFARCGGGHRPRLAQRKRNVFQHAKRRKQRALLKQHAHARRRPRALQLRGREAKHAHAAAGGRVQPHDLPQQRGFARARAAHEREHFAAQHRQIQPVMHHLHAAAARGKAVAEVLHLNDGLPRRGQGEGGLVAHMSSPTLLNSTAKRASIRMTEVIAVTTEEVVPCPRLSVLGFTRSP